VVLRYVVGDAIDRRLGLAYLAISSELPFEVGALVRCQIAAHPLEPQIDAGAIDILLDMTPLIEERHNSAIFHSLIDRISIDDPAKFHSGTLLLLHQGRTRKAEIAGVWEHPLHARVHLAILTTMAFVDQ